MPDRLLLLAVSTLVLVGLAMVWSASAVVAYMSKGSPYYFFWKHFLWTLIGFGALFLAYQIDYTFYWRHAGVLFLGATTLLVLVLIPGIGSEIAGVKRWFHWGFISFQPSEVAKICSVIFLAAGMSASGERLRDFASGLLPHLAMVGMMSTLVVAEPDLGSGISILAVSLIFLFIGGARLKHLAAVVLAALPAVVVSLIHKPYQMKRLLAFLDPWKDPGDSGFQIIQSMVALGHGGFNGQGLGDGRQKLFFLPAAHTDFVLAVIGEEMGLLGIMAVAALFGVFWWRGMRIARGAPNKFGTYLALGLTVMIAFQAVVNAGVVLGMLPTKGLVMPFLSYGGSALAANLFAVGILLNISQAPGSGATIGRPRAGEGRA
jgi:cell division protein FtsW